MEPTRVVILNGKTADEPEIRAALEELLADGIGSSIHITGGEGDAERFAADAARAGAEQLIAFGGDGTLNSVATGIDSVVAAGGSWSGVVGIVPTGTANDFATCAGIPTGTPSDAVIAMRDYRPVALDFGRSDAGLFLNVVTAGFGSEVSASVSDKLKSVLGRISYLVAGAANVGDVEPRRARIRAPEFDRTIAFYLLAIGNGRCAGGGIPVCPDANPADGQFDVTIVPEGTVGRTVGEILDKGMWGLGDAGIRFRCPWLEIEADEPIQLNLDGEPATGTRFRFEVNPGALRVLLPPDCPMLQARACGEAGEVGEVGEVGTDCGAGSAGVSPSRPPSVRCEQEPRPA